MRDDRRDLGGADKLAQTAPQKGWAAGRDITNLGCCIPESGDVCEGWKTDSIDGVMEMEEGNKNENKWHLGLMGLIIIGLSVYLIALSIKWCFFMDQALTAKDRITSIIVFIKVFAEKC